MDELLRQSDVFQGLAGDEIRRLSAVARPQTLRAGEYLFLLGDHAGSLYIVLKGKVDLCFPMPLGGTVKDITVESATAGRSLGWSALVRPYRFTLSARATESSLVAAFARHDLLQLFDADAHIGRTLLTRISELVGIRLLTVQALWARELQRTLATETERRAWGIGGDWTTGARAGSGHEPGAGAARRC